jgi:predicted enzyme related to lactoylglutathione lyase
MTMSDSSTASTPSRTRQPQRVEGVALYRIEPGRLHGDWTAALPGFDGRTGIEIAEKQGGIEGELPGHYHVRIWNPGEPTSSPPIFEGTLRIMALPGGTDPQMESYQLAWTKPHSTEAYAGLGLRRVGSDQLTVSYWSVEAPGHASEPQAASQANRHPAVMFEIIARHQEPLLRFYRALFGWSYELGTGNFAYVKFPAQPQPLLGGIGQANPSVPGFEPGRSFYLLVDDLRATLNKAQSLGGSTYVEPTAVDGYHFAMMKDPEGNIIGLIQPFTSNTGPHGAAEGGGAK